MLEEVTDRLARRDFMIVSIASAGASAALLAGAGTANAQEAAAGSADAGAGTVYTGDTIRGKEVVSALDVNDLEAGKRHRLYFQGVETPTGQHCYVSVTVAKGAKRWCNLRSGNLAERVAQRGRGHGPGRAEASSRLLPCQGEPDADQGR